MKHEMVISPLSRLDACKGEWEACGKVRGNAAVFDGDSACWKAINAKAKLFDLRPKPPKAADSIVHATSGPGDFVKVMLIRMGMVQTADCGCASFQQKMNDWGWLGCLAHGPEIVSWFAAKAKEQGIAIDSGFIWKAVVGVIKGE